MKRASRLVLRATVIPAVTLSLLAGCGDDDNAVARSELETGVADELEQITGVRPSNVECPGDLEAEVDANMRCTASADDGSRIGLTVTVTGVDGSRVDYYLQVDDEVMPPE